MGASIGRTPSSSDGGEYDFARLKDLPSCPPSSAVATEGVFFVFHDSDPPDQADFQTAAQRSAYPNGDECERRSNSVWSNLTALQNRMVVSRYLVCKTNDRTIEELKGGAIPIRSAILRPPLWLIDVRPDGAIEGVWQAVESELPGDVIPAADVLLSEELEAEQASDSKLASFVKSGSDAEVAFDGGPVENHEIDARFFGNFFVAATELFQELCKNIGIGSSKLKLGMTSQSSYAVKLNVSEENNASYDIFQDEQPSIGDDRARQALDWFASLMVDEQPTQDVLTWIRRSYELRQQYGKALEILSRNSATLAIRTRTSPRPRKVSGMKAGERLKQLRDLGYPFRHMMVRGRLIGGYIEKSGKTERSFAIRVMIADKFDDYRGTVSNEAVDSMQQVNLGDEVEAKLQIEEAGSGQSYVLVEVRHADKNSPHWVK